MTKRSCHHHLLFLLLNLKDDPEGVGGPKIAPPHPQQPPPTVILQSPRSHCWAGAATGTSNKPVTWRSGRRPVETRGGCHWPCSAAGFAQQWLITPSLPLGCPVCPWGAQSHLGMKGARHRFGSCMPSQTFQFYPFKIDAIYLYMI